MFNISRIVSEFFQAAPRSLLTEEILAAEAYANRAANVAIMTALQQSLARCADAHAAAIGQIDFLSGAAGADAKKAKKALKRAHRALVTQAKARWGNDEVELALEELGFHHLRDADWAP